MSQFCIVERYQAKNSQFFKELILFAIKAFFDIRDKLFLKLKILVLSWNI